MNKPNRGSRGRPLDCSNTPPSESGTESFPHAILQNLDEALEKEAADFYAHTVKADRAESREFARASRRSFKRQG